MWRYDCDQARQHRISEALHGSYGEEASVLVQSAFMASAAEQVHVIHTKQSHRLSPKVWFVLAKSLGIKMHTFDKPVLGPVLYILALLFAIAFSVSHTWFIVYDIVNIYTRQTVPHWARYHSDGAVLVCSGSVCKSTGEQVVQQPQVCGKHAHAYAHCLQSASAAGILVAVGGIMTLLTSITASQTFSDAYCHNVSVSVVVCKVMFVSRVGYSVGVLSRVEPACWHCPSVCLSDTHHRYSETHPESEADGRLHEYMMREREPVHEQCRPKPQPWRLVGRELGWRRERSVFGTSQEGKFSLLTGLSSHTRRQSQDIPQTHPQVHPFRSRMTRLVCLPATFCITRDQQTMTSERPGTLGGDHAVGTERPGTLGGDHAVGTERLVDLEGNNVSVPLTSTRGSVPSTSTQACNREVERGQEIRLTAILRNWCEDSASVDSASSFSQPPPHIVTTFTIDDILIRYWKISTRLRTTSMALQRWLVAWVFYILLGSGSFIMYWVSHDATLMDISQFILPILLLPLVCSAFAEVNNEGIRMVKAFGFAINYSTIVTALGALGLAFCSRIILDEMKM
ncbi:hypothetical protein LSAT2_021254 [Lamellibrachia satsuma]|nr:hypothetical protein LSAT2_021254 [Lamellibrachia satsuma]